MYNIHFINQSSSHFFHIVPGTICTLCKQPIIGAPFALRDLTIVHGSHLASRYFNEDAEQVEALSYASSHSYNTIYSIPTIPVSRIARRQLCTMNEAPSAGEGIVIASQLQGGADRRYVI
jgi:hypothetical protein